MKKRDPVEQALDRLADLKNEAGGPAFAAEIRAFLKNRSNLVVAKAAKIACQARATELVPELLEAFHRLMKDPSKLDKGCAAATEIVSALYELDYAEPDVSLRGIHHVQMEGSFGPKSSGKSFRWFRKRRQMQANGRAAGDLRIFQAVHRSFDSAPRSLRSLGASLRMTNSVFCAG